MNKKTCPKGNVIKLRPYKMMVLKIMSKNANNRKQLELKSEI